MTEGERLIAQGMERGRERMACVLLNLLRQSFGKRAVAGEVERQVMAANMSQLERWTERILQRVVCARCSTTKREAARDRGRRAGG